MPLEIAPRGPRVLVEQIKSHAFGGIELPENVKNSALFRFRVVSLGEEKILPNGERVPFTVKPGDEIMFDTKHAAPCGEPHFFGGRDLALVHVDGILAVMTGEPDAPQAEIVIAKRKVPVA